MARDICGLNHWCTDCSYLFSKGRGGWWYVLWVAANCFHGDSMFVYIYIYIYIYTYYYIYILYIYIYIHIFNILKFTIHEVLKQWRAFGTQIWLVISSFSSMMFPYFAQKDAGISQPGVYLAEELATWEDLNPDALGSNALGLQEIILPNIWIYIYMDIYIYGYIYMRDYHNEWTNELGIPSNNVECPRTGVLSASPCICQSLLWLAHGASTNVASYFAHGASSRLPFHCLFRMVVRGDDEDPMHRGAGGKGWPRRKGEEQIVRGDFISFICVYIMCKYIHNI